MGYNELLEKPSDKILSLFNGSSYIFATLALASAIAWIVYVANAVKQDQIGGNNGLGEDDVTGDVLQTATVMFQATVVSILLYFVSRHHYRCHY
jgi:hypothetical protein